MKERSILYTILSVNKLNFKRLCLHDITLNTKVYAEQKLFWPHHRSVVQIKRHRGKIAILSVTSYIFTVEMISTARALSWLKCFNEEKKKKKRKKFSKKKKKLGQEDVLHLK